MRTATTIEASGAPWGETVEFVVEAEGLGLDVCWVAEAWGSDAPSPLGYLAARTHRLLLGSGVIQVGKPKFIVWFHHLLSVWRLQPDNSKPNVPRDIASVALRVRRRPSRCSTITPS